MPKLNEEQLKKLEETLKKIKAYETLGGNVPTTKEVATLVRDIIKVVRQAKEHLEKQVLENKVEMSEMVEGAVSKLDTHIKSMEKIVGEHVQKMEKSQKSEIDTLAQNLFEELKKVEETIPLPADLSEIHGKMEEVEKKIQPPLTGDKIIEEINTSEELIDRKRIEGLEDELKAIRALPRGRGGGVSALGVRQAFKYIFHTEAPTGDIDSVNTTYTVANPIWAIIGFTLNGEQIAELPNYTFANRTITFGSALPAAYSGKDFEVKYIG